MNKFKDFYYKGKKRITNISLINWLIIITAFYLAGSVMQNVMATKSFGVEGVIAITTGGTLISWIVFGCIDVITEVWGKKRAVKTFICGALLNLFFNAVCWVAIAIPGTSSFIDPQYATILGTGWRIVIASISAFLLGTYVNTLIMHIMKTKSKNSNNSFGFMIRSTVSTLVGQFIDNFLFYLIAFAPIGIVGTIENSWIIIVELAGFTTLIETVVQAFASPLAAKLVKFLKKKKADDVLKLNEIEENVFNNNITVLDNSEEDNV